MDNVRLRISDDRSVDPATERYSYFTGYLRKISMSIEFQNSRRHIQKKHTHKTIPVLHYRHHLPKEASLFQWCVDMFSRNKKDLALPIFTHIWTNKSSTFLLLPVVLFGNSYLLLLDMRMRFSITWLTSKILSIWSTLEYTEGSQHVRSRSIIYINNEFWVPEKGPVLPKKQKAQEAPPTNQPNALRLLANLWKSQ